MAQTNQFKIARVRSDTNHFGKRINLPSGSRCGAQASDLEVTFAPNVKVASDTLISTVLCLTRNASIHEGRLNIRFSG